MLRRNQLMAICLTLTCLAMASQSGCRGIVRGGWEPVSDLAGGGLANPLAVPLVPRELVMDEVADEVDDYFRVLREQRIRLTDNILTEGWIDTEPKIGSTLLEPWRNDSSPGFELAHSTLQTVRRWARVRVIPNGYQYLVDVKVYKELEDLLEPENATTSSRTYGYDSSLYQDRNAPLISPPNRGWIPMGRDFALEQRILANIQQRILAASQPDPDCERPNP